MLALAIISTSESAGRRLVRCLFALSVLLLMYYARAVSLACALHLSHEPNMNSKGACISIIQILTWSSCYVLKKSGKRSSAANCLALCSSKRLAQRTLTEPHNSRFSRFFRGALESAPFSISPLGPRVPTRLVHALTNCG